MKEVKTALKRKGGKNPVWVESGFGEKDSGLKGLPVYSEGKWKRGLLQVIKGLTEVSWIDEIIPIDILL